MRGARVFLVALGLAALGACTTSSKSSGGAGGGAGAGASGTGSAGVGGAASDGAAGGAGSAGVGGTTGSAGAGGTTGSAGAGGTAGAAGGGHDAGADGGGAGAGGARDLSADRAAFFGPTRCAQAHVQLCEDFESGTLDPATWTTIGNSSMKPVIDGVQKARGEKALHIKLTGSGQSAIRESKTFPAPNDTYYGRAFVYFASLPTPVTGFTYSHWTMIAATGTQVSGEIRVGGQLQNGANHWGVGTDNRVDANGTGDWTNSDKDPGGKPLAVPTGQWLCIEWMHKGDTSETRFWWDGVEHPSLSTNPATPHGGNASQPFILPQFKNVWLGWAEYQTTTQPFELWLDEIAIDKDRIGCVL